MRSNTAELAQLLPAKLKSFLTRYLDMINERLESLAITFERQLTEDVRDQVELIFLLRLLYGTYVIGLENVQEIASFFAQQNVGTIKLGNATYYVQDNALFRMEEDFSGVAAWQDMATELNDLIQQLQLDEFIDPELEITDVIQRILNSQ